MTQYWCVNFDSKECMIYGIEHNLWMMQYQYKDESGNEFQGGRQKAATTSNWKRLPEINEGDWFVAYLPKKHTPNGFFAFGRICKPRKPATSDAHVSTVADYLTARSSHEFDSGIIHYTDAPVFYEDYDDEWRRPEAQGDMRYAQRIDVEEWQYYQANGIPWLSSLSVPAYEIQKAFFQIDKESFDKIVKELKTADDKNRKPQEREIRIFPNADKSEHGFETTEDFKNYLKGEVFSKENGRYRHTDTKNADIIILSRDGLAYGQFEIVGQEKPNDEDLIAYPKAQKTYLVEKSTLYNNPVRLSDLSIKGLSWTKKVTEDQYQEIQKAAKGGSEYSSSVVLPESQIELERVLRVVTQRLGQGVFRDELIQMYEGKCAITGCNAIEALEAAHIDPYCNTGSNDPSNGLLLRADIHKLFDRNLVGIEPDSLTVHISASISNTEYGNLNGKTLLAPQAEIIEPNQQALERRWNEFQIQD
ncbi:HNH endonuclease [Gimesia benthica]|uniref:HNH endonuclease n=1 Tax=Gimesia benthica TaxID=2608982 RepID=A0A6I6AEF3_9PLAN|nr:HNH endonuclease signature motif containing protein [Gimesia benthica]QGQ23930.1 HNH endonuclease [Gimesia benthica]